ncbi:hypothetical protein [Dehalobacter sp.]|uniref:hypothetical protein n=1 Tax=Dehalobacter sp. TaxID=1962289 RepID=UPI002587F0C3|nr:hypothetical protein [Dehalobacter sp.]MDJ0306010.1 hypothetical protein [Dehalobacter sp.]
MLEKLVKDLTELYTEDFLDYQELLRKMNTFRSFLDNMEMKERLDERLEQALSAFSAYRDESFVRFRERAVKSQTIQEKICSETGNGTFGLLALQPRISKLSYEALLAAGQSLQRHRQEVLELDRIIIPRLQMELEAVKLELHRFQNVLTTRNAYHQKGTAEARFINKLK